MRADDQQSKTGHMSLQSVEAADWIDTNCWNQSWMYHQVFLPYQDVLMKKQSGTVMKVVIWLVYGLNSFIITIRNGNINPAMITHVNFLWSATAVSLLYYAQ